MHDFYSDTKTKPTAAMRQVVLSCDVGDEQKGEDPTTNELCARVAALLGKEAAVFLPSGSMCNEIAIRAHTSPGDEIICDRSCHIINFETGAPAAISSVMISALPGQNGIFTPEQVRAAIRPASRYAPKSALLCVEQTANMGGGAVWPFWSPERPARICPAKAKYGFTAESATRFSMRDPGSAGLIRARIIAPRLSRPHDVRFGAS